MRLDISFLLAKRAKVRPSIVSDPNAVKQLPLRRLHVRGRRRAGKEILARR